MEAGRNGAGGLENTLTEKTDKAVAFIAGQRWLGQVLCDFLWPRCVPNIIV